MGISSIDIEKKLRKQELLDKEQKRLYNIAVEYYFRFYSFIYDKSPRKFFEPKFTKNYFREEKWRIGL